MSGNRTTQYGMDPDRVTDNLAVRSVAPDGHVDPAVEFLPDTAHPAGAAAALRSTSVIRARAAALLARAARGESAWFTLGSNDTFDDAARTVAEITRERYPWDDIPYHSRWRHFEAGGVDRKAEFDARGITV